MDIEQIFGQVVKEVGGQIVSDLVGSSPAFNNADYIFPQYKVVAELKCLEKDKSNDPHMAHKLVNLWTSWTARNLVKGPPPLIMRSDNLPDICKQEMMKAVRQSIHKRIIKANRQLKETKEALGIRDYRNLLIISNSGNFALSPPALVHILFTALRHNFSELNNFLVFTSTLAVKMGSQGLSHLWLPCHIDETDIIEQSFYNELGQAWFRKLKTSFPLKVSGDQNLDPAIFWKSSFQQLTSVISK